jgi:hypothetical protein
VEDLEVVEEGGAELDAGLPFGSVEQFGLEASPEGLDQGVVAIGCGMLAYVGRCATRVREAARYLFVEAGRPPASFLSPLAGCDREALPPFASLAVPVEVSLLERAVPGVSCSLFS